MLRHLPLIAATLVLAACNERGHTPSEATAVASSGPSVLRRNGSGPVVDTAAFSAGPSGAARLVQASAAGNVSHLIWQNTQTGERGFWQMQGTTYTGTWVPLGGVGTEWDIAASADLTCDAKPDIVWQNTQTGERGIWVMNGTTYTGQWLPLGSVGTEWRIITAADFTADGKADIVWENSQTGERGIWVMNCATYTGQWAGFASAGTVWRLVGAADFANADNKPDLLWENNTTGERLIWAMNGTTYTGTQYSVGVVAPQWHIVGAGDLTCDSRPDIIWQDQQTGERIGWPMNGPTYIGSPVRIGGVGTEWDIAGPFEASACSSFAVTILSPTPSSTHAASLNILASVTSPSQVTEVLVLLNGVARGYLVYSQTNQAWEGVVPLDGYGTPVTLELRAKNASAATTSSQVTFNHDTPPVMSVPAPIDSLVATPSIRVTANCTDDVACTSVQVRVGSTVLATGGPNFNQNVSLAAYDGQVVSLIIEGTDGSGQKTSVTRGVYSEASGRLTEVSQIPTNGVFQDVYGDSLLYLATVGANVEVRLRRIATGSESVVKTYNGTTTSLVAAFMIPGTIVTRLTTNTSNGNADCTLFSTALNDAFACGSSLRLAGDYMVWQQNIGGASPVRMFQRQISTQTNTQFLVGGLAHPSLAADGGVAFQEKRYKNGVITDLSTRNAFQDPAFYDGTNQIVPMRNGNDFDFVLFTSGGQELTLSHHPNMIAWHRLIDHGVNNGWAMYPKNASGNTQMWTRSPAGVEQQAGFYLGLAAYEGLGPAGQVLYRAINVANGPVRRFFSAVPYETAPTPLSSDRGVGFIRGSTVFVLIGRSLMIGQ